MRAIGRPSTLLAALAVMLAAGGARADGGAATDAYDDVREHAFLDVHALIDVYAQHDFAKPSGDERLRAFDVRSDTPSLQLARLMLGHRPEPLGFRVDVGVGDTPNDYLRSDPARAAHPGLSRGLSYVEQAFVTAIVPLGRGLALDVGKFGTPVGLEDNESTTNWNYSRSLLFTMAEPTYHSGLRATYAFDEAFAMSAFWVNGWDTNVAAGNGMRTFGLAASWDVTNALALTVDYLGGPERAPTRLSDDTMALRHELDAYAVYSPTKTIAMAATADYGNDRTAGGVSWWGVGGYLRVMPAAKVAGTVRAEVLADPRGWVTGSAQRVTEVTATIELRERVKEGTVLGRVEVRRDQSDQRFFEGGSLHQDTVTLALAAWF